MGEQHANNNQTHNDETYDSWFRLAASERVHRRSEPTPGPGVRQGQTEADRSANASSE